LALDYIQFSSLKKNIPFSCNEHIHCSNPEERFQKEFYQHFVTVGGIYISLKYKLDQMCPCDQYALVHWWSVGYQLNKLSLFMSKVNYEKLFKYFS
jgi:hypothetical protein